ncbi:MAG: hypothetical protein HDS31_01710 [Bacteroides sp.]|nr:hypothetical protein [Bacteroides sp.]
MTEKDKFLDRAGFTAALGKINDKIKKQAAAASAPIATETVPGIVKPGTSMTVDANGVLDVKSVAYAKVTGVPSASATTAGVMKAGTGLKAANGTVSVDTDKIADKEYVDQAVEETTARIIGAAPDVLDTFEELSKAINNDENFASTVLNSISTKANSADVYSKTEVDEEFLKFEDIEALSEAEVLAICEETLV